MFLKNKKSSLTYKKNNMSKYLLVLLFLLSSVYVGNAYSQDSPDLIKNDSIGYIVVNGYIEKNNKSLENASVIVYKNNKKIAHLRTPPNGKFNLKLDYGRYYKIEITKMGMVTKRFEFDTQLPAGINKGAIFPFEFTVVLFPKYNYIDMSILDKPLAIIRYDKRYEDYFYDYNYAKTINDKVIYIQNKIEELTKEYAKCVDDGRQLYDTKQYRPSLAKFERAHDIFPDEPYPIEKIALLKKILNEKKTKKQIYDQILQEAENNVNSEEYETAIDLLGQAMQVLPNEKYPTQRIREIRKIMDGLVMQENSYKQAVEKADIAFSYFRYQEAKMAYEDASKYFPKRSYPKDRIMEINKLLASGYSSSTDYNENITQADKLLEEKNFKGALELYKLAGKQQPEDKYSKQQINAINNVLATNAKTEEEYNKSLSEANKNFSVKNYDKAKTFYKIASNLKPGEKLPKQRLHQIDSLMTFAETDNKSYDKLISDANEAFKQKKYSDAKQMYQKASEIKPYEIHPKDKIISITNLIKQQNDTKVKYEQAIKQADKLMQAKNFEDAKQFYQVAGNINPEEVYPMEQIVNINKTSNNNDALKQNYDAIISKADKLYKSENYERALANYQLAKRILPEQQYSSKQIEQINKLLQTKLSNDELYAKALWDGDKNLTDAKYQEALTAYNLALSYKPAELYPQDRINFINKKLSELSNSEEDYNNAISEGDLKFTDKKYAEAKNNYLKANRIKPNEIYPKTRLAEINRIQNELMTQVSNYDKVMYAADRLFYRKDYINAKSKYEEASVMFPNEQTPKDRLKEIAKKMAEKDFNDKAYAFSIKTADSLYNVKSYTDALTYYRQASELKPNEIYAVNRIQEINRLNTDIKGKDDLYNNTIAEADKLLNSTASQRSIATYQRIINLYKYAQSIKPEEAYPGQKIEEITNILEKLALLQKNYDVIISDAEKLLKDREYIKAKIAFQDAMTMKPDEQYPREKIKEIENALLIEQNKIEAYWKVIEDADENFDLQEYTKAKTLYIMALSLMPNDTYPKDKIDEINKTIAEKQTINESYTKMILVADRVLSSKDFEKAKELYQKALELKPDEKWPKDKLAEIDRIIKGFEQNKQIYGTTIKKADDLYDLKQFKEARDMYKKARDLYPIQKYPKVRIAQINELLRAEEYAKAIGDISNELIEKRTEKKFTFTPIVDKKGNNYVVIEAKNLSKKPYKVLVYYGKDDAISGGFVLDVKETENVDKYVVRVGLQPNWFKVMNNWISINPLGGDLEIHSIQIQQGN